MKETVLQDVQKFQLFLPRAIKIMEFSSENLNESREWNFCQGSRFKLRRKWIQSESTSRFRAHGF